MRDMASESLNNAELVRATTNRQPGWIASWEAIVRRGGGAASSPGTLRGNPTPLESLGVILTMGTLKIET